MGVGVRAVAMLVSALYGSSWTLLILRWIRWRAVELMDTAITVRPHSATLGGRQVVTGKVAHMSGPAVVGYIHDQMSLSQLHFTYADLERLAGIREQRLSQWKRGTQPSYRDVQKLGRALAEYYPGARIGAFQLLEVAGYAPEPDPSMIAFAQDVRTWDALTLEFRKASRWERLKAIQAIEDLLVKKKA
ncbi:helix-turn-helix transcriptional regulator [Actinomadura sp. NPDC023710]|uniref:helix-turn-helix domain-containing protein n=1 Tax=Actinomadura sp. NPDC023710 TaxID=3158219 RepID=UPI0033DCD02E